MRAGCGAYSSPAVDRQNLSILPCSDAAIAEAARLIGKDGRLLIVDFAAHDREDLRDREGHARLGFDDDQMDHMFAAAGLQSARTIELAGGELTVKLWLAHRSADAPRLRAVG